MIGHHVGENTPWQRAAITHYADRMKQKPLLHDRGHGSVDASHSATGEKATVRPIHQAPSAEEVAKRAYFRYLDQGSLPGHDVQHWIEAERHLLAEHDIARA